MVGSTENFESVVKNANFDCIFLCFHEEKLAYKTNKIPLKERVKSMYLVCTF
jgi:hypothetical protein